MLREGAFPEDDGEIYESDEDTTVQVHPVPGHYDPLEEYVFLKPYNSCEIKIFVGGSSLFIILQP